MDLDEHRQALQAFFATPDPELKGSLNEALYSVSERGLWPDDLDSVSAKQALLCWRIVEKLRVAEFPRELRM